MLRISKESKMRPEKVLEKAKGFFGTGGVGLEMMAACETDVRFEGGGGFVVVEVCERGKGAEVTIETREWEYQAKEFLGKV